jgi:hypothetical protein
MGAGRLALLPGRNDVSTLVAKHRCQSSSSGYVLDSMWDTQMMKTDRNGHEPRRG